MNINFSQIKPYFTPVKKYHSKNTDSFTLLPPFELLVNGLPFNYYTQEVDHYLLFGPPGTEAWDNPIMINDDTIIEVELYKKVKII